MTRMDHTSTPGSAIAGFVRAATLAPESAAGIASTGVWSLLRTAAGLPLAALRAFVAAERRRADIACLRQMDDRQLRDIGICRNDINRAVANPDFRRND